MPNKFGDIAGSIVWRTFMAIVIAITIVCQPGLAAAAGFAACALVVFGRSQGFVARVRVSDPAWQRVSRVCLSTIVVAANAQLLRRLDLRPEAD